MKNFHTLEEIVKILEANILLDDGWFRQDIHTIYSSDLMSDILSFCKAGSLLITGLINPQTIRTAEMVDIAVICFVHDKLPHEETANLARQNKIILLSTKFSMFEAIGKLYTAEISKCDDRI